MKKAFQDYPDVSIGLLCSKLFINPLKDFADHAWSNAPAWLLHGSLVSMDNTHSAGAKSSNHTQRIQHDSQITQPEECQRQLSTGELRQGHMPDCAAPVPPLAAAGDLVKRAMISSELTQPSS